MTVPRVSPSMHILHVIICFCTFGFIFPHALMENFETNDKGGGEPENRPSLRQTLSDEETKLKLPLGGAFIGGRATINRSAGSSVLVDTVREAK